MSGNRRILLDWLRLLASAPMLPHRFRPMLLRMSGVAVGNPTLILSGLSIARYSPISIGSHSFVNYGCYFDAEASITISNDVQVGDHVRLITSSHMLGPSTRRAGRAQGLPIHIGSGVWVGSGVTVLPGVSIGSGCILAAGAVVTKDTLPNGLYAGVPARRIRDLTEEDTAE